MSVQLHDNPYFQTISCPSCGGENLERYFETPFSGLKAKPYLDYTALGVTADTILRVDRCLACGLVFVNPRIRPEFVSLIYNQCKATQAQKPALQEGTPEHRRDIWRRRSIYLGVLLKLISLCGRQPPLRLLDYGAGFGHTLALAQTLGLEGYGLELDQARLALCRRHGLAVWSPSEFEDRCAGLRADLVTIQSVLEHLVELEEFFSGVESHCHQGTVIYVNGCTPGLIARERKQGQLVKAHFLEHLNYFPPACLDRFLARFHLVPAAKVPLLVDNRRIWVHQRVLDKYRRLKGDPGFVERFYVYRGPAPGGAL